MRSLSAPLRTRSSLPAQLVNVSRNALEALVAHEEIDEALDIRQRPLELTRQRIKQVDDAP